MNSYPLSSVIVVIGQHITENLQHHKRQDVIRILEEKGLEVSGDSPDKKFHFYARPGGEDNGMRTLLVFDDKDFIHPEVGVQLYGQP